MSRHDELEMKRWKGIRHLKIATHIAQSLKHIAQSLKHALFFHKLIDSYMNKRSAFLAPLDAKKAKIIVLTEILPKQDCCKEGRATCERMCAVKQK